MTVLKQIFTLIQESKFKTMFYAATIINISTSFVPGYFLANINYDANLKYFVLASIINVIIGHYYCVFMLNFSSTIRQKFIKNGFIKYDSLDFESKNITPSDEYYSKLDRAGYAISCILNWGFTTVLSLVANIFGALFVFLKEGLYQELLTLVIINILVYFCISKGIQDRFTILQEKIREENQEFCAMISNYLPQFESGDKSIDQINNLSSKRITNEDKISIAWRTNSFVIELTNSLSLVVFLFTETLDYLLIITATSKLTSSLNSVMQFMNQYNSYSMDYIVFNACFNNCTFKKQKVVNQVFTKDIEIKEINIKRGSLTLVGDPFEIKQGDKILIRGKSGSGKSTFINALLGKIKGITFDSKINLNVVEFYQQIKEKMPTRSITVRQLFDDEEDDKVIDYCLKVACSNDWIMNLTVKEKPKFKPQSWFSTDMNEVTQETKHPYDIKIFDRHSGGQKTRLAIATKIYQVIKKQASILILDEFEQGSDPDVAYEIIEKNIMKEFPNLTIIVISHLEKIEDVIEWSAVYQVRDGVFSRKFF